MSAAMSQEVMPFFDSAKSATKHALQAAGVNFKTAGAWLWPEKDIGRAEADLRNALNDNRNEELDTEQHILLAKKLKRYDYVHYICHKTSHARPSLITPEERAAVVQEALVATADRFEALLKEFRAARIG